MVKSRGARAAEASLSAKLRKVDQELERVRSRAAAPEDGPQSNANGSSSFAEWMTTAAKVAESAWLSTRPYQTCSCVVFTH
jgi:hypothetical protein